MGSLTGVTCRDASASKKRQEHTHLGDIFIRAMNRHELTNKKTKTKTKTMTMTMTMKMTNTFGEHFERAISETFDLSDI